MQYNNILQLSYLCSTMYGAHTESFDNASSQPNYEAIMSAENKNGLAAFTHYTHTHTQAF